jgi:adenylate kinase
MSAIRPRLVLLGKQGAGKGTQAVRIAKHYGIPHIATGDLFRAAVQEGSVFGQELQSYMDKGDLVPDEIVIGVIEEQLGQPELMERGVVLDGFPRNLHQAQVLDELMAEYPLDVVVDLDVPTEIVLERIAGRRVCARCGANYHVVQPPAVPGRCDRCGGAVVQRDDDTEDAVMRRLELYELQTLPLIHFYRRSGKLAHVDGRGRSEDVFLTLVEVIDRRVSGRTA